MPDAFRPLRPDATGVQLLTEVLRIIPFVGGDAPRPFPRTSTLCLLGLYSAVALLAHARHPYGVIPFHTTAWYPKAQPTFTDVLAAVRRHCWGDFNYSTSAHDPDVLEIPRAELSRLAYAVCYSHRHVQSRAERIPFYVKMIEFTRSRLLSPGKPLFFNEELQNERPEQSDS
jgi:hypothetical protein